MKDYPLISIIVPIYNSEKTIMRCIESIISQSYKNFEILLIDDGSTDNSFKICTSYSQKDKRIKSFHKKNEGVSSSRNYGLNIAQGEYITFIDSDDYVLEHYLEHLLSKDSDLVICGFKDMPNPNGNETYLDEGIYNNKTIIGKFLSKEINSMLFKSVWCKLFKSEIIYSNKLTFNTNLFLGEDSIFVLQYLCFCTSISTIPNVDYMYYIPTSIKKYTLNHENYRFSITIKVKYYNILEHKFNIQNKYYIETELYLLTGRLFMNELQKRYSFSGFNDFSKTFCMPEIKELNTNHGGRLFRLCVYLIQKHHLKSAFLTLRFIYPIILSIKKRDL